MNECRVLLAWLLRAYLAHLALLPLMLLEEYLRVPVANGGFQSNGPALIGLLLAIPCAWLITILALGHNVIVISFRWLWALGPLMRGWCRWFVAWWHWFTTGDGYSLSQNQGLPGCLVILAAPALGFLALACLSSPAFLFLINVVFLSANLVASGSYGKFRNLYIARAHVESFYKKHPELEETYSAELLYAKLQMLPTADPWPGANALLEELQVLVEKTDKRKTDSRKPERPADPAAARVQQIRVEVAQCDQRIDNLQQALAKARADGQNTTLQERTLGTLRHDRQTLQKELTQLLTDHPNLKEKL